MSHADALILGADQVAMLRFDAPVHELELLPDAFVRRNRRPVRTLALDAAPSRIDGSQAMSEPASLPPDLRWREFARRRDGMIHAMDGGLWMHRHVWFDRPMAHLVSTDRERLLAYGRAVGIPADRLQYKPLKDPRTGLRRDAWHWDLIGRFLPDRARR